LPKGVSVIIPTYNREKELIQSIQTVMDQKYNGDIEIVIIDDSTKSLKPKIEKEFSKILHNSKNRHINYIHKAKKEGAALARNIGIKESKGDYIAFLDDDDVWKPEKIGKQVDLLEKHKDVALVICYSLDKRFGHERVGKPPEIITHEMVLKSFNLSSSSSYLVRKNVIEELGGFDISLPSAQEYDLAIRLSKNYKVRCIPEVLMIQHATKGQISENWRRKIKGIIAIYRKHGQDYGAISFIDGMKSRMKFVGMLALFSMGFVIGNRIYSVIIPMKERHEE